LIDTENGYQWIFEHKGRDNSFDLLENMKKKSFVFETHQKELYHLKFLVFEKRRYYSYYFVFIFL
jgi:hypothetical protein